MTEAPATSGLTPCININGVAAAMEFYQRAFGAVERARNQMGEDSRIIHGHMEINGAPLFMSDFYPEHGFPIVAPQGYNLHLQVDDAAFWFNRAVAAGAKVLIPLKTEFRGDIYGQVRDPYGVAWALGQTKPS